MTVSSLGIKLVVFQLCGQCLDSWPLKAFCFVIVTFETWSILILWQPYFWPHGLKNVTFRFSDCVMMSIPDLPKDLTSQVSLGKAYQFKAISHRPSRVKRLTRDSEKGVGHLSIHMLHRSHRERKAGVCVFVVCNLPGTALKQVSRGKTEFIPGFMHTDTTGNTTTQLWIEVWKKLVMLQSCWIYWWFNFHQSKHWSSLVSAAFVTCVQYISEIFHSSCADWISSWFAYGFHVNYVVTGDVLSDQFYKGTMMYYLVNGYTTQTAQFSEYECICLVMSRQWLM